MSFKLNLKGKWRVHRVSSFHQSGWELELNKHPRLQSQFTRECMQKPDVGGCFWAVWSSIYVNMMPVTSNMTSLRLLRRWKKKHTNMSLSKWSWIFFRYFLTFFWHFSAQINNELPQTEKDREIDGKTIIFSIINNLSPLNTAAIDHCLE